MSDLESGRDLSHTWLHVDMDAFYAAVEVLSDPERLKGRPMAVGGTSMICTASYEVRDGERERREGGRGREIGGSEGEGGGERGVREKTGGGVRMREHTRGGDKR